MRTSLIYWAVLGALGFLHMLAALGEWVPYYVSLPAAAGVSFYFYKRTVAAAGGLGWKVNGVLAGLQLLAACVSAAGSLPAGLAVVPLLLFIGLEYVRLSVGRVLTAAKRELAHHEEQREHMNETFRVVRGERHDFLKHVSAVHFMLESGKSQEAKTYLDELVDSYEETNYSIKGERGSVAGVLHQMYGRAKASGVSVVYDLDVPLSTLPISDQNMVTLLGNLLSNGLDACEEWQRERGSQALLSLQFYKRSGLFMLICKNSSLPVPTDVLDGLFQSYGRSTKGGAHEGLGTKMIMDIVAEHHGFLDFVHKNEEFTVKIKVPAIR